MTDRTDQVEADRVLAFAHTGDPHRTNARQRNVTDFLSLVAAPMTRRPGMQLGAQPQRATWFMTDRALTRCAGP